MPGRAQAIGLILMLAAVGCTPAGKRAARADASGGPAIAASGGGLRTQPMPRQIVRRGTMGVQVEQLPPARQRLERVVAALGGQVARSTSDEDDRADYTLRVPADRLDAMMDSVAALGAVQHRTVSADDVTDQVVDAEARLSALRASRDRLRQLLERAGSVPDVLAVERELARVQGEIESFEGRLAALRSQVAMSELAVALERRPVYGPLGLLFRGLGTLVERLWVWR